MHVRESMHKFNLNIKQLVQFFFLSLSPSHPSLYIYVNISVRIKFSLLYPPIKLNIFYFIISPLYLEAHHEHQERMSESRRKEKRRWKKRNRWTWASGYALIISLLLHLHLMLIGVLLCRCARINAKVNNDAQEKAERRKLIMVLF